MGTVQGLTPAQAAILEKYFYQEYKSMYYFALSVLRDESKAEVAVQDTFITASEKISDLVSSPNPVGWLYNVLKYKMLELRRSEQKENSRAVPLDDVQELSVNMDPPSALDVEKSEDLKLIRKFYVDGYSLKDLSKEMKVSMSAVKMRIKRAKNRLRDDPYIQSLKDFKE